MAATAAASPRLSPIPAAAASGGAAHARPPRHSGRRVRRPCRTRRHRLVEYGAGLWFLRSRLQCPVARVAPSAQTPSGIPANGDNARFTRHQVTWTNHLTPLPAWTQRWVDMQPNMGWTMASCSSVRRNCHPFRLEPTLWAGFAEARYRITPQFSLSGRGVMRHRRHPSLQPAAARRLCLGRLGDAVSADVGKAYKLPSFYALGNPSWAIQPEAGRCREF